MSKIEEIEESFHNTIKILNETTWESKLKKPIIDKWLDNFADPNEKFHALFLLSNFMYFGDIQIKQLLISLFRDLYKFPIVEEIRRANSNTVDNTLINDKFKEALSATRFVAMGNSSESGAHLLYTFRQINKLSKELFDYPFIEDSSKKLSLKDSSIRHYVLFDDFCGSGSQALDYSKKIVDAIKATDPTIKVSYLMLFSTKKGRSNILKAKRFDIVEAVVEIDESFKLFGANSRYLQKCIPEINKSLLKDICERYGEPLIKVIGARLGWADAGLDSFANSHKLGFGDCQLLIGFSHNTPDNTLPIIWFDEDNAQWYPIFKRYNKIY